MIARLLIAPDAEIRIEEIKKILDLYIPENNLNHPDLLYFNADQKLGIAEARKIKEHFSLKPYSVESRIVVLEDASVMTQEAQNSLLKTLEELPQSAVFILGASSDAYLLPTIISRCQITILKNPDSGLSDLASKEEKLFEDLTKLLNAPVEERFGYIEKLKDKESFLIYMVKYFRQILLKPQNQNNILPVKKFLKELLQAEKWAKQNVNIRGILEYLMLVMPQKI